jgi:hypothetical protein
LRDDCLSLGKLLEDGFLTETPVILGWQINMRTLSIQLPNKKFKRWNQDLSETNSTKMISFKELEKLIGRLNHAASACPIMRYFLNRLRKMLQNWESKKQTKKVKRYISSKILEDLKLWHKTFLPKINLGMSLNLITYRRPSVMSWSDACPQGMRGYDSFGRAWQYKLSDIDTTACKRQNNSLEFTAALISVWAAILNGTIEPESCFLALCDNSSAVSWLHKANIDDSKKLPLHMVARKFAEVLLQADCCLYSQHISGQKNVVADLLSRHFTSSHDKLSSFIISNYPSQAPQSFQIYPLPPEILSWLKIVAQDFPSQD